MIVDLMDREPAIRADAELNVMVDEIYPSGSIEQTILECLQNREALCLRDLIERMDTPFETLLRTLDKMEIAGRIESIKPIGFKTNPMSQKNPGFFSSIFFREIKDMKYPRQFKRPKLRRIHLSKYPQLSED